MHALHHWLRIDMTASPTPPNDASIEQLSGIGPKTASWLREVGVETVAELRALGPVEAYRRLKFRSPRRISLNALWALYGALHGIPWNRIPAEVKERLLAEAKSP